MAVELLRIDDRLIHGQVVEGWLPHLKAEHVVVWSGGDEVARALMQMAMPPAVTLEVQPAAAPLLSALADGPAKSKKTLVLVPGPAEALALLEGGLSVAVVNVGGLHYNAGKVQLGKALFLDDADRRALAGIARRGVRLEGRALPSDPAEDVAAALGAR
ncbi:MAG: PTS sugar transporter subunit IIB [Elusimicrobiota bacterium]|nr:PTS sugar transporter subunit IIB [Elusimicrobiota bacterium]